MAGITLTERARYFSPDPDRAGETGVGILTTKSNGPDIPREVFEGSALDVMAIQTGREELDLAAISAVVIDHDGEERREYPSVAAYLEELAPEV